MGPSRYFTGEPCKRGHIAERFLRSRICVECAYERRRADPRQREKQRIYKARHLAANRAAVYAKQKENAEQRRRAAKRWRERVPEKQKAASKRWRQANRASDAAKTARRKAAKLRATPAWADHAAIAAFYAQARALTEQTGVRHQVDHVIPLQGRTVCGLHVETNLQVLTAAENARKFNRWQAMIDNALEGL